MCVCGRCGTRTSALEVRVPVCVWMYVVELCLGEHESVRGVCACPCMRACGGQDSNDFLYQAPPYITLKKKALKLISLWGHMCHGACTSEDNLKGLVLFPLYGTQVAGIRLPLVLVSHWTRSSPFWVRLADWWAHERHLTPLLNARIQAQTPMSSFWGRCWGFKLRTSHTEFTCS